MVKEHPGVGVVDLSGCIDGWCCCAEQGPKLTFLGRRQLATEIFFQSP